ncbi:MFS transporter [Pirellulaceae bacterium]|nr:MFS transporter [Pirellulaceae bacterium]
MSAPAAEPPNAKTGDFYGWTMVPFIWILYGAGSSPGFYSWSFFSSELIDDLDFSRANIGFVFGLMSLCLTSSTALSGLVEAKWGARTVCIVGNLLAAFGFGMLATANSLIECSIYYGICVGTAIGFGTIVPCQTMATHWFDRYRGRVVAFVLTAGGVVGCLVTWYNTIMINHWSWRTGFLTYAALALILAGVARMFIRNTPREIGQYKDGIPPEDQPRKGMGKPAVTPAPKIGKAVFAVFVLCALGFQLPWSLVVAHGRLHLEDLGFGLGAISVLFGSMTMLSVAGRLCGGLGDFMKPNLVLGVALLIEASGLFLFLFASYSIVAWIAIILLAIGFGGSYMSLSLVVSNYVGAERFSRTIGLIYLLAGFANAPAPGIAGWMADTIGGYAIPFMSVSLATMVAGFFALRLKDLKAK